MWLYGMFRGSTLSLTYSMWNILQSRSIVDGLQQNTFRLWWTIWIAWICIWIYLQLYVLNLLKSNQCVDLTGESSVETRADEVWRIHFQLVVTPLPKPMHSVHLGKKKIHHEDVWCGETRKLLYLPSQLYLIRFLIPPTLEIQSSTSKWLWNCLDSVGLYGTTQPLSIMLSTEVQFYRHFRIILRLVFISSCRSRNILFQNALFPFPYVLGNILKRN